MTRLEEYPVFWPEDLPFFASPRDEWTRAQTQAWADLLRRSIVPRSDQLRALLGISRDVAAEEQFAVACRVARELTENDPAAVMDANAPTEIRLRGRTVAVEPGAVPSAPTFSLGIDLALLLVRLLVEAHPDAAWAIVWKPRDHVSYRNPVLTWPSGAQIDPFAFGRGFAGRLANRNLDDAYARRLFDNWDKLASGERSSARI